MTYRGRVQKGMVILEGQPDLPEGTLVSVEPLEPRPLMELVHAVEALAKAPSWPADGATQLDHYLYGIPKQEE